MSWETVDGKKLRKVFKFPDFKGALQFVNRVGAEAEKQNHHPDIHLFYGRVEIETWSHDAGGITDRDHRLSKTIDQLYKGELG